jgi:pilus assembly protein CpaB
MGRRTLLLIASILVAALGTSLIWLYVQGADNRGQQGADLVPALFFKHDAVAGTDAAQPGLTEQRFVPAAIAATAVTNTSQLAGQRLQAPAFANQIVVPGILGSQPKGRFPKDGAVAISISEPNRVPADLARGDVVDVFSLGANGQGAQLVAPCVIVRSVGPPPGSSTGSTQPAAGSSVSGAVIGFDVNAKTAKTLYDMVASGAQPALYDHNPDVGCPS